MDNWIIDRIKIYSQNIAVVFDNCEYTYGDLLSAITNYHSDFQAKFKKGEVIGILSDYSFDSIAAFFALYLNKNIIVPIITKVEAEISNRISVASCTNLVSFNGKTLEISTSENRNNNQLLINQLIEKGHSGLILFSSGSTGEPKAMIHNLDNLIDSYKDKKGRNLVFMIFLMFDHIGGLNTMLNCVSTGITMVFPKERKPDEVCSLIEKYGVNILPTSPTFLNLILLSESYKKFNISSLRMITYGTEPMPESLLLKLRKIFPGIKFLQTFGTSETGITSTSSQSSDSTFIKLNDPNTEFKIVEGELWIRSKTQILGYLNYSMDKFTNDGWFKTGDLVEPGDNGFIKIIGRNKEIINVGGEKVLPTEVESVLLCMPEVEYCIVYGESNPIIGQMVVAKVLLNIELKPSDAKKMIVEFCADKLARYKIPSKVLIMSSSEYSDRFKKKRLLTR